MRRGSFSCLKRRKNRLVYQQLVHAIHVEAQRRELVQSGGKFNPQLWGVQGLAIDDDDVDAAARLASIRTARWSEVRGHKAHSRDVAGIQIARKFLPVDPRRSDQLKRRVRAAANREIRPFDQAPLPDTAMPPRGCEDWATDLTHTCPVESNQSPRIQPFIGTTVRLASMCLSALYSFASSPIVIPCRTGIGLVVDEAFLPRIRYRPLNIRAVDGIRAIKNHDRFARFGGSFQEISQRSLVGVEAGSGILDVINQHIKVSSVRLTAGRRLASVSP